MTQRTFVSSVSSLSAAAILLASHAVMAQVAPAAKPLQARTFSPSAPEAGTPDRAGAYYHIGLAHLYEELAVSNGRQDYAAQAVEEYKLALNADPNSKFLQDGLADLYFKIGRIREAVTAAQDQVKHDPNDAAAHTLLGKVYLRSLNDMQGPQATEMLQLAIAEYEKLAQLNPKEVETHLILGQLYGINHDSTKAQTQFKLAQSLDGNSEEAVLNMARLYSEQGEPQKAIAALSAISADDRSARIDSALGSTYDGLKQYGKAATAYAAANDQEPGNPETVHALAAALLNDNQLAQALDVYQQLVKTDPTDAGATMKISEIQRRQGHYDEALATLNKAKTLNGAHENLELVFNEAVLYDALGKYDQAVQVLRGVLADSNHLNGVYSDPEKSNRGIFLDRLAVVYREENKPADAVEVYQQMMSLGGEYVTRAYQGQVDTYREAHQWKEAVATSAAAAAALPKDKSVQLNYALQLADTGESEKGLALANAQLTHTNADRETEITIATIDVLLHRSSDAQAHFATAETMSSKPEERMDLYLRRATALDHDKKHDAAEAEYRKALALDPNSATILNDLGYMLADRGVRLDEALAMVKKAVELDPQNGSFLDSLGWTYFKLGQYAAAEENLRKAIDRNATDASIHDHLGEVYEKTGRLKLAATQWERAMTEYAHSLPADTDPAEVAKVKQKLDDARVKLARLQGTSNKKS